MRSGGRGRHQASRRSRPGRPVVLVVAVAAIAGATLVAVRVSGGDSDAVAQRTSAPRFVTLPPPTTTMPLQVPVDPTPAAAAVGVPVRITIARAGVDSALDRLGLTGDGLLRTPTSYTRAAWFERGVRPGETGPAVIAGHVDSTTGPAVFFRLDRLRPGDVVQVRDSRGVVRPFVVTGARRFPKSAFGTREVYGPTTRPELRLITCSGVFDSAERSYRDNLVVFATLREPRAG